MSEKFIELQRCRDAEAVEELREILTEAKVRFRVAGNSSDATISSTYGMGNEPEVIVSVLEDDFERARATLEKIYGESELSDGHYLREMSDEELSEVVGMAELWVLFAGMMVSTTQ